MFRWVGVKDCSAAAPSQLSSEAELREVPQGIPTDLMRRISELADPEEQEEVVAPGEEEEEEPRKTGESIKSP